MQQCHVSIMSHPRQHSSYQVECMSPFRYLKRNKRILKSGNIEHLNAVPSTEKNIAEMFLGKELKDSSFFCDLPVLVALLQGRDSDPQS